MGKRGPVGKTQSRKKLEGTIRKDRCKNYPTPSMERPEPPGWLDTEGIEIFNQLVKELEEINLASASFSEGLGLLAARLTEVRQCTRILDAEGRIHKTNSGVLKMRPEVSQRSEAMKHAQSLLRDFGLSPAGLGRIEIPETPKDEKDQWSEFDG